MDMICIKEYYDKKLQRYVKAGEVIKEVDQTRASTLIEHSVVIERIDEQEKEQKKDTKPKK